MPLDLPITLVAVHDIEHEACRLAIESTLAQITPQQILIFTDAPEKISIAGAEYHYFNGRSVFAAAQVVWYSAPSLLNTDHLLHIQADSWVLDASLWTDEFLDCDYIGAPWPVGPGDTWARLGYTKGRNVGNGGFSMVSAKFARHIANNAERYPLIMPGDDSLCRRYRPALEEEGFRWATEELATRFSFECAPPPIGGTFGFHGFHTAKRLRNEL
jgi:hypothetical protein